MGDGTRRSGMEPHDASEGDPLQAAVPDETPEGPSGGSREPSFPFTAETEEATRECPRCGADYHPQSYVIFRDGTQWYHEECFDCRYEFIKLKKEADAREKAKAKRELAKLRRKGK